MKKVFFLILFVAILTIGCSKYDQQKKAIDYGQPVKVTVAWNDIVYSEGKDSGGVIKGRIFNLQLFTQISEEQIEDTRYLN